MTMQENIQQMLANEERLDQISQNAENLNEQVGHNDRSRLDPPLSRSRSSQTRIRLESLDGFRAVSPLRRHQGSASPPRASLGFPRDSRSLSTDGRGEEGFLTPSRCGDMRSYPLTT